MNKLKKLTALIPKTLLEAVHRQAGGRNLTQSIIKALHEWSYDRYLKRVETLSESIKEKPLKLKKVKRAR